MRQPKSTFLLLGAVAALLAAWAHQAMTKDQAKTLPVLSTSDIIGYTSPCG